MRLNVFHKKAFTLIELLVVIAIIALLMAVILPALRVAKQQAGAAVCLANQNQLLKSWYLYAEDSDDEICSPHPVTKDNDFVGIPLDDNDNPTQPNPRHSSVDEEINGIKHGTLYPYFEAPKVMHCPSDFRSIKAPFMTNTSKDGAYRTYSLIHNVGASSGWGTVEFTQEEHLYKKTSQIKSTGSKYILVEEGDGRGFNLGSWVIDPMTPDQATLIDPIAIFHNGRSTLGFADGHAERMIWQDEDTIEFAESIVDGSWPNNDYGWTDPDGVNSNNPDVEYLKRSYCYRR